MSPSHGLRFIPRKRFLIHMLWGAFAIPVLLGLTLGTRQVLDSALAVRQLPPGESRVAPVPIGDFARLCARYTAPADRVLLVDAGFNDIGGATMDGYDDWNAAQFAYALAPAHVLFAPNITQANLESSTYHPQFIAVWLQHNKPESSRLHLPEYANELRASRRFALVTTYHNAQGDTGLLFASRQA